MMKYWNVQTIGLSGPAHDRQTTDLDNTGQWRNESRNESENYFEWLAKASSGIWYSTSSTTSNFMRIKEHQRQLVIDNCYSSFIFVKG